MFASCSSHMPLQQILVILIYNNCILSHSNIEIEAKWARATPGQNQSLSRREVLTTLNNQVKLGVYRIKWRELSREISEDISVILYGIAMIQILEQLIVSILIVQITGAAERNIHFHFSGNQWTIIEKCSQSNFNF